MISFTEFLTEVFDAPVDPADVSDHQVYKGFERDVYFYVDDIPYRIYLRFAEPLTIKTNFNRITIDFYVKDRQGREYTDETDFTGIKQAYRVLATVKQQFINFVQDVFKKFEIEEATIIAVASNYSRERVYTKMFRTIEVPGFTVRSTPNRSQWIVSKK